MSKTAVVILNWNGAKMLRTFLPSVIAGSGDADIVVADNGSTDDSLQMLKDEFPSVKQLPLGKNYGFAEGYNRAIAMVNTEYVVLLNSDVEVTEGWLTPLEQYMEAHPDVAACQPKLLAYYDRALFEYAGGAGGYIDRYGYPFCRGRLFGVTEKDNGQYDDTQEVLWATGACLLIRRDDYLSAGGLDGRFFAHNEEIDLCWRLNLYGRKVVCITESVVYHLGGGTLPQGNPRKTYLNFRNNLTMLYKNLPDHELHHVLRMRFFLDYLAALQSLLTFHFGDVKAIYRARRDFYRWLPEYKEVRKNIQEKAKMEASTKIRKPFSLLWHFYVLRHKLYSQLPE